MDEAQSFDWLGGDECRTGDGHRLAAELLAHTRCNTLDAAFIALVARRARGAATTT